jgi:hypothetical protein
MWAILRGRALQVFQTIHASRHMRRGSTPGKKGTRVPIGVLARKDARRDRREAESEETKQKRRATNTADKHKSLVAAKLKAGIMADSSRDRERLDAAVPGLLRKSGSLVMQPHVSKMSADFQRHAELVLGHAGKATTTANAGLAP